MIEVSMKYFRAAAECVSTEETRYYLNGVHIAPHPEKGVVLTATDDHRLISLHDAAGKCTAPQIVAIDRKALEEKAYKDLCKAMPEEMPRITIDDEGIATVGTYRSLKSCFIDGTFPDWPIVVRSVLAKTREGKYAPSSYNQKYVAAFGKIATMLSPDKSQSAPIRIISFNDTDPILIRFGSVDYAFGVLMPMRSSIPNELPIWMKPILEPTPTAAAPEPKQEPPPAPKAKRGAARRSPPKRQPARAAKKKSAKRRAA